jgi:hypothetical protein
MQLLIRRPSEFEQLAKYVRRRPLHAMALSAGAGFMLAGGLRSRLGLALGMVIGRALTGAVVVNAIESLSEQNARQHRRHQRCTGTSTAESS